MTKRIPEVPNLAIPDDERLVTRAEVLSEFRTSTSTLYGMMAAGKFPRPVMFGGAVRWVRKDLNAYKAQLIAARDNAPVQKGA